MWCTSTGADAQIEKPKPATVADYMREAGEHFSSGRYHEFVKVCMRWEEVRKDFSASYNVALGLLYAGDVKRSKAKISEIESAGLNAEQREKIDQLRQDIVSRESHVAIKRSVSTGSVIMSQAPNHSELAGAVDRSSPNRSGASMGLKPDQVADFMEGLNRMQLEQAGYAISPRVTLTPMDLPMAGRKSDAER